MKNVHTHTIDDDDENGMPERRNGLGREHDQGIQEVILTEPPINTNHMGSKRYRDPD